MIVFRSLFSESLAFNQLLVRHLSDFLARQTEGWKACVLDPDAVVATAVAILFREQLRNGGAANLKLTQLELARLIGLSRQRVNEALLKLEQREMVKLEYGRILGVDVNKLEAFRTHARSACHSGSTPSQLIVAR